MDGNVHVQNDFSNVGRYQYFVLNHLPPKGHYHIKLPNGKVLVKTVRGYHKLKINNVDWQAFIRVIVFEWYGFDSSVVETLPMELDLEKVSIVHNHIGSQKEVSNTILEWDDDEYLVQVDPLDLNEELCQTEPTLYDLLMRINLVLGFEIGHFLVSPTTRVYNELIKDYRAFYRCGLKSLFVEAITPTQFDVMVYRSILRNVFS